MTHEHTRERLLEAARAVFSEHGFQGATVREICRRAEANVAAVNYHFGSKDGLLAEALNFNQLRVLQVENAQLGGCPQARLRQFVHGLLTMLLDESQPTSQCRIMARELADPTPLLDQIVSEAVAPMHNYVRQLLREIVGDRLDEVALRRCLSSLLAQCFHYRHAYPVLQRLHPTLRYTPEEIAALAEHIVDFSLFGLLGMSEKRPLA